MKWNEAERKNETSNAEIDHRNANNTINIILSCSVGANSSVEAKLVFGGCYFLSKVFLDLLSSWVGVAFV